METPDPARRPVIAWRTIGAAHTVTMGRIGTSWYVEHTGAPPSWHAMMCDSHATARILADRERATVPGRAWLEFEPEA